MDKFGLVSYLKFGSRPMSNGVKNRFVWVLFLLFLNLAIISLPGISEAQATSGDYTDLGSAQKILISLTYFMNSVLMPLLFGIALLFFLVNATRYFIIEGGNEASRDKARLLAFYGIAAFVFLLSLWGIVNLFVNGLNLNQEASMCPDYLGGWCGNDSARAGGSIFSGRVPTDNYSGGTDTNNGGTTGSGTTGDGVSPIAGSGSSAVADVMFGDYQDDSNLNFTVGDPRAVDSTVAISETAACDSAITSLQQASEYENTQAAYLLYTDVNGVKRWLNVTDQTDVSSVSYDGDTITNILNSGAEDLYLVHTHQSDNLSLAGVDTDGYPPSTSDFIDLCDSALSGIEQVVIDWNNVWMLNQPSDACPRRSDETSEFPFIESMLWLSQVEPASRAQELEDLVNADNISNQLRTDLTPIINQYTLDAMSTEEIINLSQSAQNQAQLSIDRTDVYGFCAQI